MLTDIALVAFTVLCVTLTASIIGCWITDRRDK